MMKNVNVDEKQLDRVEAIIHSMTKKEKANPDLLNNSRRKRIANGSGTKQEEVGKLVKQFGMVNKMSKQMAGLSGLSKVKAMKELGSAGGGMSEGDPTPEQMQALAGLSRKGSSFTPSVKDRFKKRKR